MTGRRSGLDARTRALVRLSAALTADADTLEAAMDEAAAVDPGAAEEVLLQGYLFLGYPVALNALGLWRRQTGRPPPAAAPADPAAWRARGEDVCRAVYAHQYEALREVMAGIHPDLDRWAVVEGYGKVLGRPGLELRLRELCIVALLSGIDAHRQLHAHLRGCLNVGASADEVAAVLAEVAPMVGTARATVAAGVWERVRQRQPGGSPADGAAGPDVVER
ncbi:MAG: carboxymuconolactone decarboxylase family protein [Gemmatimonadota bacterium]